MPGLIVVLVCLALLIAVAFLYDRRQRNRGLTAHDADEAARQARGKVDGTGAGWPQGPGWTPM